MNYIYISNDATEDLQKENCISFCNKNNLNIDEELSNKVLNSNLIVCSDFSRFGSSRTEAVKKITELLQAGSRIISAKSGLELFGEQAINALKAYEEISSTICSASTLAGLKRAKMEGRVGGRKAGTHPQKLKLTGHEEEIRTALKEGESIQSLASRYSVQVITMRKFIELKQLQNN